MTDDLLSKNKYVHEIPETYAQAKCQKCNSTIFESFCDDITEKLVFRCIDCHWVMHTNLRSFRWDVI